MSAPASVPSGLSAGLSVAGHSGNNVSGGAPPAAQMLAHQTGMHHNPRDPSGFCGLQHCNGADCSNLETLCFEPEGGGPPTATGAAAQGHAHTENFSYVGQGRGGYEKLQNFNFVGDGYGSFKKDQVTQYTGWRVRKCCFAFACLLGVMLFLTLMLLVIRKGMAQAEAAQQLNMVTSAAGNATGAAAGAAGAAAAAAVAAAPPNGDRFDCKADFDHWQTKWSIDRIAWCCDKYGRGCPETDAPSDVAPPPPASPSLAFDCDEGSSKRWKVNKKVWCCQHFEKGCPGMTSLPFHCGEHGADPQAWSGPKKEFCCAHFDRGCPSNGAAPKFNCQANVDEVQDWTDNQKAWCCEHESVGCPPGTEKVLYNCDEDYHGPGSTASWDDGKKAWCCLHKERGCPIMAAGAAVRGGEGKADPLVPKGDVPATHEPGAPAAATPAPTTPAPSETPALVTDPGVLQYQGCDTACSFQGYTSSCKGHIQWSANRWFVGSADACTTSYRLILKSCPMCNRACPLEDANCVVPLHGPVTAAPSAAAPATTAPSTAAPATTPSHASAAAPPSQHHVPTTAVPHGEHPPSTSKPYDCAAGFANWKAGWSVTKKAWCCLHEHLACPSAKLVTSDTATTTPYDCLAGLANWKAGWSVSKKVWCCKTQRRGCPDTTVSEPYDCAAAYFNWQKAWSESKKEWCCQNKHRGCPKKALAES